MYRLHRIILAQSPLFARLMSMLPEGSNDMFLPLTDPAITEGKYTSAFTGEEKY